MSFSVSSFHGGGLLYSPVPSWVYSKVVIESFDPVHKAKRRSEVLPLECQRAFEMGQRMAGVESIGA